MKHKIMAGMGRYINNYTLSVICVGDRLPKHWSLLCGKKYTLSLNKDKIYSPLDLCWVFDNNNNKPLGKFERRWFITEKQYRKLKLIKIKQL